MSVLPKELEQIYEKRREQAERLLSARKEEVYACVPELARLEDKVMSASMRFFRNTLNPEGHAANPEALEAELSMLQTQRAALLLSNGYASDYLTAPYKCSACKDTGHLTKDVQQIPCACSVPLFNRLRFEASHIEKSDSSFERFSAEYYPDVPNADRYGTARSPRDYMCEIKDQLIAWAAQFDAEETKNLYLHGNTGTGKTWLAKSIGRLLLSTGKSVLYISAPVLFDTIRAWKFADADDLVARRSYRQLSETELLIIDDLGTEPASDARFADLLTLLEARSVMHGKTKRTIISTNLDIKRLYVAYNERIGSRIAGSYEIIRCIGDDIRLVKRNAFSQMHNIGGSV